MVADVNIRTQIEGINQIKAAIQSLERGFDDFAQGINEGIAEGLKEAGIQADKTDAKIKKLGKTTTDTARKLETTAAALKRAGTFLTLGVTVPLLGAAGAAVNLASNTVESENLFQVAMGDMADAATEFSKKFQAELGINEYTTRKTIGTIFQMVSAMGLNREAAFEMSKNLTQLTEDLASFFNLSSEEALLKLQSGIVGETEPLRRLGVIISEDTVKQELLNRGFVKQGEQLTQQQKIIGRYLLILKSTQNAQGDLARTIESPANQLRLFGNNVKLLTIQFGNLLIPVMGKLLTVGNQLAKWTSGLIAQFKEVSPEAKSTALTIGLIVVALGPTIKLIGYAIGALVLFQKALELTVVKIIAIPAGFAVLGFALYSAITNFKDFSEAVAKFLGATEILLAEFVHNVIKWFIELARAVSPDWLGATLDGIEARIDAFYAEYINKNQEALGKGTTAWSAWADYIEVVTREGRKHVLDFTTWAAQQFEGFSGQLFAAIFQEKGGLAGVGSAPGREPGRLEGFFNKQVVSDFSGALEVENDKWQKWFQELSGAATGVGKKGKDALKGMSTELENLDFQIELGKKTLQDRVDLLQKELSAAQASSAAMRSGIADQIKLEQQNLALTKEGDTDKKKAIMERIALLQTQYDAMKQGSSEELKLRQELLKTQRDLNKERLSDLNKDLDKPNKALTDRLRLLEDLKAKMAESAGAEREGIAQRIEMTKAELAQIVKAENAKKRGIEDYIASLERQSAVATKAAENEILLGKQIIALQGDIAAKKAVGVETQDLEDRLQLLKDLRAEAAENAREAQGATQAQIAAAQQELQAVGAADEAKKKALLDRIALLEQQNGMSQEDLAINEKILDVKRAINGEEGTRIGTEAPEIVAINNRLLLLRQLLEATRDDVKQQEELKDAYVAAEKEKISILQKRTDLEIELGRKTIDDRIKLLGQERDTYQKNSIQYLETTKKIADAEAERASKQVLAIRAESENFEEVRGKLEELRNSYARLKDDGVGATRAIDDALVDLQIQHIRLSDTTRVEQIASLEALRHEYGTLGAQGAEAIAKIDGAMVELRSTNEDTFKSIRQNAISSLQDINRSFSDTFADVLVEGADFKEGIKNIFTGIAKDLISTGLQDIISSALFPGEQRPGASSGRLNLLNLAGAAANLSSSGSQGNLFATIFGAGSSAAATKTPGGIQRAIGGPLGLESGLEGISEAVGGFDRGLDRSFRLGIDKTDANLSQFNRGFGDSLSEFQTGFTGVTTSFLTTFASILGVSLAGGNTTGALVGGILGTAVGAYFGGPAGAQIGGSLGAAIGGAFQTGGQRVVTRPTLFMAGETGSELVNVRPLNGARSVGGGVTLVLNGPSFFDDISVDQLGKSVLNSLIRAERTI